MSVLWLKWTQTTEIKQNEVFFHWIYSNLTPYLSLSKDIQIFQWLSKSKFLSCMTKVNPKNGIETSQTFFCGTYSNTTKIFQWLLLLELFNLIVKVNTFEQSEIKSHRACANLTVFFLIYKVAYYLNYFWHLFLDKIYLKNEW